MGFNGSFFGGFGGGAASSDPAYTNLALADLTKMNGSYTLTHSAGSASGFNNRISMASTDSVDHAHLTWDGSGAVYYDTGVAFSTLASEKGFEASLLLELDASVMNSSFAGFSDSAVNFGMGIFISNGPPGTGDRGFYNGIAFRFGTNNRIFQLNSGLCRSDAQLGSGGALMNLFSTDGSDHFAGLAMHVTGGPDGTTSSPTAQILVSSFTRRYLNDSDSDRFMLSGNVGNNREMDFDNGAGTATGNLHVGLMVSQDYISGTPSVKAFDFNLHFQLLRFGTS